MNHDNSFNVFDYNSNNNLLDPKTLNINNYRTTAAPLSEFASSQNFGANSDCFNLEPIE